MCPFLCAVLCDVNKCLSHIILTALHGGVLRMVGLIILRALHGGVLRMVGLIGGVLRMVGLIGGVLRMVGLIGGVLRMVGLIGGVLRMVGLIGGVLRMVGLIGGVLRMVGLIFATKRLDISAPKKHRSSCDIASNWPARESSRKPTAPIPSGVKPMALKLILTAFLLDAQHWRDSVENKPASLLVMPLKKAHGVSPSYGGRQMGGNS